MHVLLLSVSEQAVALVEVGGHQGFMFASSIVM
jgi:hypothetical protein